MRRRAVLLWGLGLVAATIAGLAIGATSVPLRDVIRALSGVGDPTSVSIVRAVRLPRVVLAGLVGASLGMSGAALQGTLRNPLAEPYLLGVSGGAAVGAVIAVTTGILPVPLAAFGGAAGAVLLVLAIGRTAGSLGDTRTLLMAGVVLGAFANAAILIVLATAPADTVRGALWWMMGSTAAATSFDIGVVGMALLLGGAALILLGRRIDAVSLGTDAAAALGVRPESTSRAVYLWASLLAAASVVAAGLVGFVGLVVPYLARSGGAARHRGVIAASGLIGATLLVGADLAARTVRSPAELPLGAVTALLGVPFFLAQLRRR